MIFFLCSAGGGVVANRVLRSQRRVKGPGGKDNLAFSPSTASGDSIGSAFDMTERGQFSLDDDGPGKKMTLRKPLEVSFASDRMQDPSYF